ncbi:DUF2147 domain-containing protein [Psychroserpens sp. MEBiC05023]
MSNKRFYILTLMLFLTMSVMSQSILGKWKTIDDKTGEQKSIVEIYELKGKVYGKIIDISDPEKQDALCVLCSESDYNKPILGLTIIKDMVKSGGSYKKGTITNPEDGKVYDCRIKLDDGNNDRLQVRGYIAFFYRTQYWLRIKD